MLNLRSRSTQKEILDQEGIPFEDIYQNMKELNKVNSLLGGHAISIEGIKKLKKEHEDNLLICEIGCGGGDNLSAIQKAFTGNEFRYLGIDIKKECIDSAVKQYPELNAKWIESDYRNYRFGHKPDIIFNSLFCHHFTDTEIVDMLIWMKENSTLGFFINDLHRNHLAYYSIKWLTKIFSKSYLVKNDAPISVTRGFTRNEWAGLLNKAGITDYFIDWKWAFRFLVTVKNG